MVKILYTGKRPFMLDGFYIHNDEARNVTEETAQSLKDNPDFVVVGASAAAITPEPVYEETVSVLVHDVKSVKAGKRGKKK